jgi:hypothetical protein
MAQLLQEQSLQQQQERCTHQQRVPRDELHQQEGGKECSGMREMVGGGGGGEWMCATFSPTLGCCIIDGLVFFGGFLDWYWQKAHLDESEISVASFLNNSMLPT